MFARLTALVKNSADLTVILDADLTATFVSPAAEHVLGHAPDEITGTGLLAYVDEEDVPKVIQLIAGLRHEDDRNRDARNHVRRREPVAAPGRRPLMNRRAHARRAGYAAAVRW